MRRILLNICYDGSKYHGWQVQNNAVTVQPVVQDALESVLGVRPGVTGCSRTDAGVHALDFYCHTDIDSNIPCDRLTVAVNSNLPHSIAVKSCCDVNSDFHARYSVMKKTYIYRFYDAKTRDPFKEGYALHIYHKLDEALMNDAAKKFIGQHDFIGFCASGSSVSDTVRTVFDASVLRTGNEVVFSVTADGFLYNMVRIMAGTILAVSEGKIKKDDIPGIIESRLREKAGRTVPPCGLYLKKVCYKSEEGEQNVRI